MTIIDYMNILTHYNKKIQQSDISKLTRKFTTKYKDSSLQKIDTFGQEMKY